MKARRIFLPAFIACVLISPGIFAQMLQGTPYCLPLQNLLLTSSFGYRLHPVTAESDFHRGIDLSARTEPVYAIMDSRVTATGYHKLLGNFIHLQAGELEVIYGHLSFILVQKGERTRSGQPIGITGRSGRVTGEHLHLSIKYQRRYLHPLAFLSLICSKVNL